jgi:ribosomal protein S27AE
MNRKKMKLKVEPFQKPPVEPLHVYDWLKTPPIDDGERDAKEWLDKFTMSAYHKYINKIDDWLKRYCLTVEWRGKRYICSGASRLGDVWLRKPGSENYYDYRVELAELSNWKRTDVSPDKEEKPECPRCGKRSNMVLHGDEWVCHSTHRL